MELNFQENINYWNSILSQDWDKTSFPYDYYDVDEYLKKTHRFLLPAMLFEKLIKISRGSDYQLFSLITAGLTALLYKYSSKESILIAIPGYLKTSDPSNINPILPLIIDVNSKISYKELLYNITQKLKELNTHKNCPLDKIIRQNNYNDIFSLVDVAICSNNIHSNQYLSKIKPNFSLNYTRNQSEIEIEIVFNSNIYEQNTISRISNHFISYTETLLQFKDIAFMDLPLIDEGERKLIIEKFNNKRIEPPKNKTIHQLFEEQVSSSPYSIALVLGDESITYDELNKKANQLANFLLNNKIKQNEIVGLLTERSIETIIGFLAILKAGGCALPIDSTLPIRRKEYILKDSQVKFLLLDNEDLIYQNIDIVKGIPFSNLISLKDVEVYNHSFNEQCEPVVPSEAAYILYTSGSTGNPKGAVITHKNLINYLSWAKDTYIDSKHSSFPLHTSISFDLTITSIFLPLITGNTIHIYYDGKDHNLLERIFYEDLVDVIKMTPSHLQIVAENCYKSRKLKCIIVGGEKLTIKLAQTIYKQFGQGIKIYNEYGPTEATVGCMLYEFEPDKNQRFDSVLIGKPSPNCQVFVLDEHKNILPFGVPGEMYIGGDQLFKGYLSNAELTNEKLVKVPFANNTLLYKTGDVAKMFEDGNMLFVGRVDEQIKLRGFRIELGEIESQLLAHDRIKEVAVIVTEREGDKYLVVYYVSTEELKAAELKIYLSQRLPDYMIPSFFVNLETLPLNQNGKIDRKALPDPEIAAVDDYVAPSNDIEKKLVSIWSVVLNKPVERISTNASFFDLGGHSLNAIVVLSRISKEFNIKISFSELLKTPTIQNAAMIIFQFSSAECYNEEIEI